MFVYESDVHCRRSSFLDANRLRAVTETDNIGFWAGLILWVFLWIENLKSVNIVACLVPITLLTFNNIIEKSDGAGLEQV